MVTLKKLLVKSVPEDLTQIVPLNCVCLLMLLRRLMDVSFML